MSQDVDIVYIGTINPAHYADTKAALLAGKHVLVEKPATLNAAQWGDLCTIAKQNKLFLMEGT
jgi:dihydrodiol dehydrogenase / D-xylose 1-dehydrogenase (NADP)